MIKPERQARLIPVAPHPEDDVLRRIGLGLRGLVANTLTEPLPGDMLVLLHRLERVEWEWRARRPAAFEPRPFA